ncbi:GATA zinc finger domain-containing protein 4 [Folsomia candida]|uniref:Uncharacterized protein n=1 Tax=Folsomia candida TaxID=158441 RepID=A0A226E8Q5_FOLCA|nr:GATA zinc finger domain-containing protein 4 [Folsomia candida]XP_035707851.1 GATA zinc finger domain-containing protein 4 [Folsomia candida]OXA53688.1 hypothetical protein Fcan01_10452 [Folsomia candida]
MLASVLAAGLDTLITGNNSNSKISGDNNSGNVEGNSNTKLFSESSKLSIFNNSNSNLNFANVSAKLTNSSNSHVTWKNGDLNVDNCSNSELNGDLVDGKCNFSSNSNFKFVGKGAVSCEFKENSNTDATLSEGGSVKAVDNSNLKISGGSQNLVVEGTSNLHIRSTPFRNRFQVVQRNNWFNWLPSFGRSASSESKVEHLTYELDYAKTGKIIGSKYSAGDFSFDVTTSKDEVKVQLSPDGNPRDVRIDKVNGKSVLFSGTGADGNRQELEIQGPKTVSVKDDEKTVVINLCDMAGL